MKFILSAFLMLLVSQNLAHTEGLNSKPHILPYQTVAINPGEFDLFVPVLTSFSVEYIKKHIQITRPFRMGKYEVTNEQLNQCYKMGGCSNPAVLAPGEGPANPAVRVNWHAAKEFSDWLSKTTGRSYRLPTEEEWTYSIYEGQDHKEVEEEYDYSDLNQIKLLQKITKPAGSFGENSWGVADFKGNVWEWTLTCWFASEENILKSETPEQLNSPSKCFTRVALGENRTHIPDFISDTYNGGCATLRPAANLGFRLVLEER